MDDHGVHGEMRNDAMNVAAVALESNHEEKDISKHIKVDLSINCFSMYIKSIFYELGFF